MTFKTSDTSPVKPDGLQSPNLYEKPYEIESPNTDAQQTNSSNPASIKWHKLLLKEYESLLSVSPHLKKDPISNGKSASWKQMTKINQSRLKNLQVSMKEIKPEPWIQSNVRESIQGFPDDPVARVWKNLNKGPIKSKLMINNKEISLALERLRTESHQKMCSFVLENFNDQILSQALEFLESAGGSSSTGSLDKVSYRQFRMLRNSLANHLRSSIFDRHFAPRRFLLYPRPDKALVDTNLIEQYLVSQVSIARIYAELSHFDRGGKEYLTRAEMTDYLMSTLPSIESIQQTDANLQKHIYVPFVNAKFAYQLDPFGKGKLFTLDLMKSRYLTLYGQLRDGGLSLPEINLNPFCMEKAIDLFEYYEEVKQADKQENVKKSFQQILESPLTRQDLNDIGDRPWNPLFLDAIFAYYYSKKGSKGMFIQDFFYFHLVVRDLETPASIFYIFRAITYDSDGKFDENLLMFYLKPLGTVKSVTSNQQNLSLSSPSLSKRRSDYVGSEVQQSRYLAWEIFRALDKTLKGYLTLRDCLQRPKLTVQLLELILFQQQTQQAGPSNNAELNESIPKFD